MSNPELIAANIQQLYDNQFTHKESILRLKAHMDGMVIVSTTFFIINLMLSILSIACLFFTLSFIVYAGAWSAIFRYASVVLTIIGLSPVFLLKKSFVLLRRRVEMKVADWINKYQRENVVKKDPNKANNTNA